MVFMMLCIQGLILALSLDRMHGREVKLEEVFSILHFLIETQEHSFVEMTSPLRMRWLWWEWPRHSYSIW